MVRQRRRWDIWSQQDISTVTNGPESVHLADADNDGDLDLFAAFRFANTVAWFENLDGSGDFGGQQDLSTNATGARFVTLADLDDDGDQDAVSVASDLEDGSQTMWFENTNGLGDFAAGKSLSNQLAGVESIEVADLNGDGTLDVTVTSSYDDRVSWFSNNGNASFGIPIPVLTQPVGLSSVDSADVDRDGDLDLVVGTSSDNRVAWYENIDGSGTYSAAKLISAQASNVQKVRAADVDGDGDMDVVSASYADNKIAWYENLDGRGSFGSQQIISRQSVGAIDVRLDDLDGDGDLDVISASATDSIIAWYENEDGEGNFGAAQILTRRAISAEWVTTADLDADGDTDILSASYDDGRIAWYENEDGLGTFSSAQTLYTGDGTVAVEAADVDNDGDLDLIGTQFGAGGLLFWIEQTSEMVFADPQNIAIGFTAPEALAIADVDGNGVLDIVVADTRQVAWFERAEDGFADHLVTLNNVQGVFDLVTADIDGDSDLDIVSASTYDSKLAFYENRSTTGDFDGDGEADDADISLLCDAIHNGPFDPLFDLNSDGVLDERDLTSMIEDVLQTTAGDANLDGDFSSSDLVLVFQEGQYEDDIVGNSGWSQGDWNCDGEFDSSDLVEAFKAGRFELPSQLPSEPRQTDKADLAAALLADEGDETARRARSD